MRIHFIDANKEIAVFEFSNGAFRGRPLWDLSQFVFARNVSLLPKYDTDMIMRGESLKNYQTILWNPHLVERATDTPLDMNSINEFDDSIALNCLVNAITTLSAQEKLKEMFTSDRCTALVQHINSRPRLASSEDEWLNFHTAIFPCTSSTAREVFENLEQGVDPLTRFEEDDNSHSKKRKNVQPALIPKKVIADGSYGVVMSALNTVNNRDVVVKYPKYDNWQLCNNLACASSASSSSSSQDLDDCKMKKTICLLQSAIHEIYVNMTLISPFLIYANQLSFNQMVGSWLCNAPDEPEYAGTFCQPGHMDTARYYSAFSPLDADLSMHEYMQYTTPPDSAAKLKDVSDALIMLFLALAMIQGPDRQYNHRDLHLGNVLMQRYHGAPVVVTYGPNENVTVDSKYHPVIIDQGVATIYTPSTRTLAWSPDWVNFAYSLNQSGYPGLTYMPGYDIVLALGSVIELLMDVPGNKYSRLVHALCRWLNALYGCTDTQYLTDRILFSNTKHGLRLPDLIGTLPPAFVYHLFNGVDYVDVVRSLVNDLPTHFANAPDTPFNADAYKSTQPPYRPPIIPTRIVPKPLQSQTVPKPPQSQTVPKPPQSQTVPKPSQSRTVPEPPQSQTIPEPPQSRTVPEPPKATGTDCKIL
jgi:hypothetical protein